MNKANHAPKISVVTISYNQVPYLRAAIESVLSQGYSNLEFIVVDAGSTDGSREIISEHLAGIHRAIFEPDRGPADGLNKGFAIATGAIFFYLNADDMLLPNALDRVARYFSDRPALDVLLGSGFMCDAAGRHLRRLRSTVWSPRAYVYGGAAAIQQSTFFRARAFKRTSGFNVANRTCWDGELMIDMALTGAMVESSDEAFGVFRVHCESITGSGRLASRYAEDSRRIFEKVIGRPPGLLDTALSYLYRARKRIRLLVE